MSTLSAPCAQLWPIKWTHDHQAHAATQAVLSYSTISTTFDVHLHSFVVFCSWIFAVQGAHDHVERLQAQVQGLESHLSQTRAALGISEAQSPKTQAELAHMRAELAESQNVVSQLQRKLQEEQAEVLMLKESQGGSNKATDVIYALESQVSIT